MLKVFIPRKDINFGDNDKKSSHMEIDIAYSRRNHFERYQTLFLGNCYFCCNFGHKEVNFKASAKVNVKKNSIYHETCRRQNNTRISIEILKDTFFSFGPLNSYGECYKC